MRYNKGHIFVFKVFGCSVTLLTLVGNALFDCQIWRKNDYVQLYFHKKTLIFVKTIYKTGMNTRRTWKFFSLCQKGVAGLLCVAGLFYVALYVW